MRKLLIVSSVSEDAYASEIAEFCDQFTDIADIISLKEFTNTEFCPRFISEEREEEIGHYLEGNTVVLVSAAHRDQCRNSLAMRNFLISRASKENGAAHVVLLEPDLFYSAQDRGPRPDLGYPGVRREAQDLRKFDGQPFSAKLYSELLALSGVDEVFTVQNHSKSTVFMFERTMRKRFHNLMPLDVFAHHFTHSDIIRPQGDGENVVIVAPDGGARDIANDFRKAMGFTGSRLMFFHKVRLSEHDVKVAVADDSPTQLTDLTDKEVILVDDMVRTGGTIVACAQELRQANPRRVIFLVTHFCGSRDARIKLADSAIDEIVTTDTVPSILNRDVQGRLRKKIVVIRLGRWLAWHVLHTLGRPAGCYDRANLYRVEMSSRHPRYQRPVHVITI